MTRIPAGLVALVAVWIVAADVHGQKPARDVVVDLESWQVDEIRQLGTTIREAQGAKLVPPPKDVNGDWLVTIRVPIELPEDSPVLATRLAEVESIISEVGGRSWVQGSE